MDPAAAAIGLVLDREVAETVGIAEQLFGQSGVEIGDVGKAVRHGQGEIGDSGAIEQDRPRFLVAAVEGQRRAPDGEDLGVGGAALVQGFAQVQQLGDAA